MIQIIDVTAKANELDATTIDQVYFCYHVEDQRFFHVHLSFSKEMLNDLATDLLNWVNQHLEEVYQEMKKIELNYLSRTWLKLSPREVISLWVPGWPCYRAEERCN